MSDTQNDLKPTSQESKQEDNINQGNPFIWRNALEASRTLTEDLNERFGNTPEERRLALDKALDLSIASKRSSLRPLERREGSQIIPYYPIPKNLEKYRDTTI